MENPTEEWTEVTALSAATSHLSLQDLGLTHDQITTTNSTQTIPSSPAIYMVAERFWPEDSSATGGQGFRLLDTFATLDLANAFAKTYAQALMKIAIKRNAKDYRVTPEELQANQWTRVNIQGIRHRKRNTHFYKVFWTHETWIGVVKYIVKDSVPDLSGRIKYLDWSRVVIRQGDHSHPRERWPKYCRDGWSESEDQDNHEEDGREVRELEERDERDEIEDRDEASSDDDEHNDFMYDGWLWSAHEDYAEKLEIE